MAETANILNETMETTKDDFTIVETVTEAVEETSSGIGKYIIIGGAAIVGAVTGIVILGKKGKLPWQKKPLEDFEDDFDDVEDDIFEETKTETQAEETKTETK